MTAWSGTRAGMVAIIVVGAAMVAGTRTLPRLGTLALITALSAIATLLGVMLVPDHTDFWLFQYSDMEGTGAFTGGRLDMWIATFNKWLEAPIFGWGSGSMFWEVRSLGWTHTQPHNVVLQFLISWGVIGAVGGLWLIGRALRAAHVHAMGEPRLLPVAGVLYALLFQSLLEGMLHYPRFIMTIMTGFAVILAHRALQLKSRAGD
jgi:O-antigen ligase